MVSIASGLETKRLQTLIRHVADVSNDCQILGTRLIERGEADLGRALIANGFVHDHSKFQGIEWEHLHSRCDPLFDDAWNHHIRFNDHHPEFWEGGIHHMPRIALAECVCDWHSRSSELDGGGLRWWITHDATRRFGFGWDDAVGQTIKDFVELLLEHWN
jgi:hypothetical protein